MPKEKISSVNQFLSKLLDSQDLSTKQMGNIEVLRKRFKTFIKENLKEQLDFYFGGTVIKETELREYFDLNIVVYWPPDSEKSPKEIHTELGKILRKKWKGAKPKGLGWEIPFKANFHVDIIPGIYIDKKTGSARFYNTLTQESLKTSIEYQEDFIQDNNRGDTIRLAKLWKLRREVPLNSFLLELIVLKVCKGVKRDQLEEQLSRFFKYLKESIGSIKTSDPANDGNNLNKLLTVSNRAKIKGLTQEVLGTKTWNKVFKR